MISHVHHNGPFIQDSVMGYPRYKPLTYFCFDLMTLGSGNDLDTVAVTCPRNRVEPGVEIYKCCPHGETLSDAGLKGCRSGKIVWN